jgi:hypothetical protein
LRVAAAHADGFLLLCEEFGPRELVIDCPGMPSALADGLEMAAAPDNCYLIATTGRVLTAANRATERFSEVGDTRLETVPPACTTRTSCSSSVVTDDGIGAAAFASGSERGPIVRRCAQSSSGAGVN